MREEKVLQNLNDALGKFFNPPPRRNRKPRLSAAQRRRGQGATPGNVKHEGGRR
jgi:hypothetical protein